MIQFYQTGMGKEFYENVVPRIAKSLKVIATKLNEDNKCISNTDRRTIEKAIQTILGVGNKQSSRDSDFYLTVMGKRFYEGTMKSLVKSLESIAKDLSTNEDIKLN